MYMSMHTHVTNLLFLSPHRCEKYGGWGSGKPPESFPALTAEEQRQRRVAAAASQRLPTGVVPQDRTRDSMMWECQVCGEVRYRVDIGEVRYRGDIGEVRYRGDIGHSERSGMAVFAGINHSVVYTLP